MFGRFRIRTDLALEARESFEEDDVKIRGVRIEEEDDEELDPYDQGGDRDRKRGKNDGETGRDIYYHGSPEYVGTG